MTHLEMLIAALLIDAVFGDPRRIWSRVPHPVVLAGRAVASLDRRLNRGGRLVARGALAVLLPAVLAGAAALGIAAIPDYGVLETLGAAILLAWRDLTDRLRAVRRGLAEGLPAARVAIGAIDSRDPDSLQESDVVRAGIEAGAEGFLDGFVAPAFWFLLLGLPGLVVYRVVDVADSVIGHVDERYFEFGRLATRLDHYLSWLPARIAGAMLTVAALRQSAGDVMISDASLHVTPNTGWPEAAMAGGLRVATSGPRVYEGERTDDPWINARARRDLVPADLRRAVRLMWRAWALGLILMIAVEALLWELSRAPMP